MSNDRDPYSRHYWSIVDDPKFEEVYDDDHHYATWGRLLMIADMAWPASAHLPANARRASVAKLAQVELIDLYPNGRYRIHGLDTEREKRSQQGRNAAASRWGTPSNASGNAPSNARASALQMPSKAEQSRDEQSTDTRAPDPADVYWTLTGRYPSDKALGWVDDLSSRFGAEAVIRALALTHQSDTNGSTLLGRTEDHLKSDARALSLKAQTAERERIAEKRAEPRAVVDREAVEAEMRKIMEAAA